MSSREVVSIQILNTGFDPAGADTSEKWLLAVSNGLKVGELAMHEVDHGGEVAGGAEASGASLGGLDEGGEALEKAV